MKVYYYFFSFLLFSTVSFAQTADSPNYTAGPEKILEDLEIALSTTPLNSLGSYTLYSETAQQLARRGNYDEADSLFSQADALATYEPDSVKTTEMRLARAIMYKEQGKYTAALQTYVEALDFYQKRQDVDAQVWVYSYLVEFYRATFNAELSAKFIQEGEALIASNEVSIRPRAHLYNTKASYLLQFQINDIESSYEKTLATLEESLEIAKESGDTYLIGLNQNGLGFLMMHQNPAGSEDVVNYLLSAKENMLINKRFRNYTSVLQTLSLYYTRSGNPEMAVDMTFEAIELSKKNNWGSNLGDLYRLAGEVYYELGKYQESAQFLNDALNATKANMNKTHSIELGELTTSYEKDIAERKLLEQQIATQAARQQAITNRKALTVNIIISLILLLIAVISIRLYFRFRKANALLRAQEEVSKKANEQLNDLVKQKNVLYKELNHRVKNNLTVLSSLIYLQEDGEKVETQKELYQTLRQRIQSIALVHQNLYEYDEAVNINFQHYLRQLIPGISASLDQDRGVVTNIQCENLEASIDEAVPLAMIINELITNSFKYAFRHTQNAKIELWSAFEDGKRCIHYRDNGPGMPELSQNVDVQKLGMMLVNLMVEQLKAKLTYLGNDKGVYFKIEMQ